MTNPVFWLVPVSAALALLLAWYFYREMLAERGHRHYETYSVARAQRCDVISETAVYKIVGWVFAGTCSPFLNHGIRLSATEPWVPVAFLTGGFFSGLSGFLGMKTATYASARTANAASNSLNRGLRVAFRSGAVMGLVVVGLGLFDISFWYLLLDWLVDSAGHRQAGYDHHHHAHLRYGRRLLRLCLPVWAAVSTPRPPTLAPTSWAKLKPVFPRTTPATPPPSPTTWATTWAAMCRHGRRPLRIVLRFYPGHFGLWAAAAFLLSGDVEMQYKAVDGPDAHRRRRYPALYSRYLCRAHKEDANMITVAWLAVARNQPQLGAYRRPPHSSYCGCSVSPTGR